MWCSKTMNALKVLVRFFCISKFFTALYATKWIHCITLETTKTFDSLINNVRHYKLKRIEYEGVKLMLLPIIIRDARK